MFPIAISTGLSTPNHLTNFMEKIRWLAHHEQRQIQIVEICKQNVIDKRTTIVAVDFISHMLFLEELLKKENVNVVTLCASTKANQRKEISQNAQTRNIEVILITRPLLGHMFLPCDVTIFQRPPYPGDYCRQTQYNRQVLVLLDDELTMQNFWKRLEMYLKDYK